jgi:hypothetical protein
MSVSEILGTIHDGALEVCASAEADYDRSSDKVTVALEAFARRASATGGDGAHLPQPWLPVSERVSEHLPREEADAFMHDVFQSWVKKVRASVPHDLPLR